MEASGREEGDRAAAGQVRLRLTVAYDGTGYLGWQLQPEGVTVQGRLEEALGRLFTPTPRVHSSSRTDTGVHATGMVVHFDVAREQWRMKPWKLVLAANAWLPDDIRVTHAARVRPGFHARFDAAGKQYRYTVWNHAAENPLLRTQAWHVPRRLDLPAMRKAAATLVGCHDFRAFSATPGYERGSTVRTMRRCAVIRSGARITVVLEADGFLYKMCRGIVGTLVQVGMGRFAPETVASMLEARDRRLSGMTAPALGLCLCRVMYRGKAGVADPRTVDGTGEGMSDDE